MLEIINNKELKLIEILAITINLFRKNFNKIILIVALLFFPISILNAMIMDELSRNPLFFMNLSEAEGMLANILDYTETVLDYLTNTLLQMAVMLFLEPVGVIAIAKITKSTLNKEELTIKDAVGEAMNCIWSVVITGVPYGILIILAFSAFVLPGIYFWIIWIFYVYAIAFRGMHGWKALAYSKKLTAGKFWKTVGVVLVIRIIVESWNWIFSALFLFSPTNIGTDILFYTLTYISSSFAFIAMTVLFMNREALLLGKKHNTLEFATESTVDEDKN